MAHTGGMLYDNSHGPLKQKVHFAFSEPQDGIALLTMTDLKLTDLLYLPVQLEKVTWNREHELNPWAQFGTPS